MIVDVVRLRSEARKLLTEQLGERIRGHLSVERGGYGGLVSPYVGHTATSSLTIPAILRRSLTLLHYIQQRAQRHIASRVGRAGRARRRHDLRLLGLVFRGDMVGALGLGIGRLLHCNSHAGPTFRRAVRLDLAHDEESAQPLPRLRQG